MTEKIPAVLLQQFSHFLAARMGLHFPRTRWPDLFRGLKRAAPDFGFAEPEACLKWLLASDLDRSQVEVLASHLSVGETYFFRDPGIFSALENDVLPALIAARRPHGRRLRIWSAGCCTGEEPYSLAILLDRLIPDLDDWSITILGTDINPHFLAKAARGLYRDWSFRGVPKQVRQGCFSEVGPGKFELRPRFRQVVQFEYLNLVDDLYPCLENNTCGMDLVLCRNVMMYFETATARAVVQRLHRSLADDGWLIVSPSEAGRPIYGGFAPVGFPEAILYRKDLAGAEPIRLQKAGPAPVRPLSRPQSQPAVSAARAGRPAPAGPPLVLAPATGPRPPAAPVPTPYQTALAAFGRGDYQAAVDRLAGRDDNDAPALGLLARACANLGQLAEARRWCLAAVKADKLDPGLRYLLASIRQEESCPEEAETALKQALYLDEEFVLAHYALGNLYRCRGRSGLAARHFGRAVALLQGCPADLPLPDAEGFTAGRLLEVIHAMENIE